MNPRFCVVGGGPVGRLLAALLRGGPGEEAALVVRPPALEQVARAGGVRLLVPGEEPLTVPVRPVGTPGEAFSPGRSHVFVVAVKGWDTAAVARQLAALAGGLGRFYVLTVQNGVANEGVLARVLGEERVLSGALTVAVSLEEDGAVGIHSRRAGIGLAALVPAQPGAAPAVDSGTMSGPGEAAPGSSPTLLRELAARLARPWFHTAIYPDWSGMKWSKLLLNLLGNATSALLDEQPAEALARPGVFAVERAAFLEACAVMDRLGLKAVSLPGYPVPLLRAALRLPLPLARRLVGPRLAGGRGGKEPSFLLDLRRGRATEAPFLHGAVAAEARRLGVPAPVCAALAAALERAAADPGFRASLRHRPDRLLALVGLSGA